MVIWGKAITCLSISLVLLTGCSTASQVDYTDSTNSDQQSLELVQLHPPKDGQDMVVIRTSLGDISIVLYDKIAPQTVKQFKKLIKQKFYDGKKVFSVDPSSKLMLSGTMDQKESQGKVLTDNGKPVEPEVTPKIWHFSGAVSTFGTKTGVFNKRYVSDSRFFIVGHQPATLDMVEQMEENDFPGKVIEGYKKLGGYPQYTGFYTVFGQVIDGMEVVDEIVSRVNNGQNTSEEIVIQTIELKTYSQDENELTQKQAS